MQKMPFQSNMSSYNKTVTDILAQCVKLNWVLGIYCLSYCCLIFMGNIPITFQKGAKVNGNYHGQYSVKLSSVIRSQIA